jgi:hypothetical protein
LIFTLAFKCSVDLNKKEWTTVKHSMA